MLVGEQSVQLDVNGGHQDPLQVRGFYIEIASLMSEVIRGVHSIFTPLVFLVLRGNRRHVLQLCGLCLFGSLAPLQLSSSGQRWRPGPGPHVQSHPTASPEETWVTGCSTSRGTTSCT